MAKRTNNEEVKQQALRALAEGRLEMSAELHRVRQHLSPMRVLKRVVDRHTGLMVGLAVTAGLIPALLLFRGKQSHDPVTIAVTKAPSRPVLGAIVFGALGMLARTVTPALIKSTVIPHLIGFISKKQSGAASGKDVV